MKVNLGAIMAEEGKILSSLITMIEPEIIVEFGTQNGFSTRLMYEAEPKTQIIYTYDPTINFSKWMDEERIIFKKKGQESFEAKDIDFKKIDLVFFDGSHDLELNKQTWERIKGSLSESAIIVVHDTGKWDVRLFDNNSFGYLVHGFYRVHQPDEVEFVKYLRKEENLEGIDLTPVHVIRHGLTLLQVKK
jgi:hypothetical protein